MDRGETVRELKKLENVPDEETMMDKYGEVMNTFLTDADVQLSVLMAAGDQEAEVIDNIGMGPVPQLFILMKGLAETLANFGDLLEMIDVEGFLDGTLQMIKEEILEKVKEK